MELPAAIDKSAASTACSSATPLASRDRGLPPRDARNDRRRGRDASRRSSSTMAHHASELRAYAEDWIAVVDAAAEPRREMAGGVDRGEAPTIAWRRWLQSARAPPAGPTRRRHGVRFTTRWLARSPPSPREVHPYPRIAVNGEVRRMAISQLADDGTKALRGPRFDPEARYETRCQSWFTGDSIDGRKISGALLQAAKARGTAAPHALSRARTRD